MHLEADYFGNKHRHRLAEHRRLCFDATNAPAKDAESVDHGRVRVCADERIRIGVGLLADDFGEDAFGEILEIDLVDDSCVGRDDAEVMQRFLSPAKKSVALLVAAELEIRVDEERCFGSVLIDLDRVVDDEIDWLEGIDKSGVAAESGERITHRGEIDDRGNSGEVLEQYASSAERYFFLGFPLHIPAGEGADVVGLDELAVFVSEQVFEEDLEAEGESICVPAREL